jgi:hypothetical protein
MQRSTERFPMLSVSCKFQNIRRRAALAALVLGTLPDRALAQKIDSVSLPIPIMIEARQVHCPLYLKLDMKRYGVPFDKFASAPRDKAQAIFVTIVQAIRKRDTMKFSSVWTSPDQMKRLDPTTTVAMVDNSAGSWIEVARSNFDFDHLNVVAEIFVGSDAMFVWETPTKAGMRREAFYVGSDRKNNDRLSIVDSNTPVLSLIKSAFGAQEMANGSIYEPVTNVASSYQYKIPLGGKGNPGTHPVYLEFGGTPMDFPVGDVKVKAPTPLLGFMRKAARDLRDGRIDSFAANYTVPSQERIKPWLASLARHNTITRSQQPAASLNAAAGVLQVMESNVKFVLDASPVFLVFQSQATGSSWTPESLSYSYVVNDRGNYKFANFSSMDDLDDFLQNSALFDRNILKSSPVTQSSSGTVPHLRQQRQ